MFYLVKAYLSLCILPYSYGYYGYTLGYTWYTRYMGKLNKSTRGKGEGSLFQDKHGTWIGIVDLGYSPDGKRLRKKVTAKTKRECSNKLVDLMAKVQKGIITSNDSLKDWLEYWLTDIAAYEVEDSTLYGYRKKMERYVIPIIGKIPISKLRPDDIRSVHRYMRSQKLTESTIRQTHAILSRALKIAERERKIEYNPCTQMDSPRAKKNPHEKLSLDDAKKVLLHAKDERDLARLTCALVLGLRQGEALALKWREIDFKYFTMEIEESIGRVPGKGFVTKAPKTTASIRTIPLPAPVAAVLMAWKDKASDSEYVFPGFSGGPENQRRDWAAWSEALERAEVHHVPLHGARGTAGSLLLEMGVPEKVISDILGHASIQVTREHYLKSTSEQRGNALDTLALELGIAPLEKKNELEPIEGRINEHETS